MSTSLPDRTNGSTGIVDTPTVAQQKTNFGNLRDFINDLFGATTAALRTVREAFRAHSPDTFDNGALTFSVAASALTINLVTRAAATPSATDPVLIGQRSATAGNGDFNLRAVTAATALVVSSGSTLGLANADGTPVYVYLIDNAGTQELAISKAWAGAAGIVSTTAEGGAGGADSATVMYSTTARTGAPFRALAKLSMPQTTAGTYAAVPATCQMWPFDPPAAVPSGLINGLTYANNGSDAVNDIDIATGSAADATGSVMMTLAAALTKRSDANWAVGTNAGGLDTGAVGNSDYYIWLIARPDTGVVDVLFSLSSTAPTMPANYITKRLIGWFKRAGGTIVAFTTYEAEGGGIDYLWTSPTLDINLLNTLTTARRTDAVKVPLNFSVLAKLNVMIYDATTSTVNVIYCPDQADQTPSASAGPLANATSTTTLRATVPLDVRTSATGTIAARSTLATVDEYLVSTLGFRWPRR